MLPVRVGSSPLARGLLDQHPGHHFGDRIIPARAGFTVKAAPPIREIADHPRSRGVYIRLLSLLRLLLGSSPLARGLRAYRPSEWLRRRIIPARAGFTDMQDARKSHSADHPRSRGVYFRAEELGGPEWGSSPLARGLLPRRGNTRPHCGIIPARAGFTLHRPERPVCHRDHPRSRGVYAAVRIGDDPAPGSSPLARGLPDDSPDGGVSGGIIPARAGFTQPAVRKCTR